MEFCKTHLYHFSCIKIQKVWRKHKIKKNINDILINLWEKKNFKNAPIKVLDILYNLETPRK